MSEWISVKDRLPEAYGYYLVNAPGYCGKHHVVYDLAYSSFDPGYKTPWGIERARGMNCYSEHNWKITHWMPLPDPPGLI